MNPFAALIREFDIAHLKWALRELHPGDPRVPAIVVRLRFRLDERAGRPNPLQTIWRLL